MSTSKFKKEFLFHLEHFYRNFGNQWTLDEFPSSMTKHRDKIVALLPELEEKGIIKLNPNNKESFTILKSPSQVMD